MIIKNYIAVDIAKDSLAVATDSFHGSFSYNDTGLKKLFDKIKETHSPCVICEATGGYERKLMELLHAKNIAVTLVNPARVRAFARSEGTKAKTDPIDAALLLKFAKSKDLEPTPPPSPERGRLQALMDRRSQLTESLTREKNRLQKCPDCIQKSIQKVIRIFEKELASIEKQIEELIAKDDKMAAQNAQMQSINGIGTTISWAILAYLGEITALSRNQLVALAGVAPYNRDSGKYKGKRRIEGGRAKVRKCLYMGAQCAAVYNPHIKAYVDGLRARGKPYKCAIVAAMRKLLIHIQSLLKKQESALA